MTLTSYTLDTDSAESLLVLVLVQSSFFSIAGAL